MEENKFTWMPKMTKVVNELMSVSPELVNEFVIALINYGTYGMEPNFENDITKFMFLCLKDDIDFSIKARKNGSSGGRGKKASNKDPLKGGLSTLEDGLKGGFDTTDNQDPKKGGLTHNNTVHNNTKQNKEDISSEISKKKGADLSAITEIVDYLNQATNKNFKASRKDTQSFINARIREGFTVDDFKAVIDGRVKAWANDPKMSEYLRPQTLFGTKFESYLNASKAKPKTDEEEWDELFEEYARYERENTTVYCQP